MPSITSGQLFFLIIIGIVVFMILVLNLLDSIDNRARIKAGLAGKKKRRPLIDLKYESTTAPRTPAPPAEAEDTSGQP